MTDYNGTIDDSLGSNAIHRNPDEEHYWNRVREMVLKHVVPWKITHLPITHVMLIRESASNEKMILLVKQLPSGM